MFLRRRRKSPYIVVCVSMAGVLCGTFPAHAYQPAVPSPSNYGGAGLLDPRTARVFPDGYFDITASLTQPDDRYSLTFQALPWLELTFRYAINVALAGPHPVLHDRSFDAKFR